MSWLRRVVAIGAVLAAAAGMMMVGSSPASAAVPSKTEWVWDPATLGNHGCYVTVYAPVRAGDSGISARATVRCVWRKSGKPDREPDRVLLVRTKLFSNGVQVAAHRQRVPKLGGGMPWRVGATATSPTCVNASYRAHVRAQIGYANRTYPMADGQAPQYDNNNSANVAFWGPTVRITTCGAQ